MLMISERFTAEYKTSEDAISLNRAKYNFISSKSIHSISKKFKATNTLNQQCLVECNSAMLELLANYVHIKLVSPQ